MKNRLIPFFTLLILLPLGAAAQITENEATPDIVSEPEAILILTEVNFKNSEADWAEIYYESPSGKSLNLKGITVSDDGVFKTVSDFVAQSGKYMLLTFKSSTPDAFPYLYASRTGLTGTTEQLILTDPNGKIIDAVCWTSSSPTTDEIKDMVEIKEKNGWHTADISQCLNSEEVKNNWSIVRKGFLDTDSSADWLMTETLTPGAENPSPEPPAPEPATTQETPTQQIIVQEEDATGETGTDTTEDAGTDMDTDSLSLSDDISAFTDKQTDSTESTSMTETTPSTQTPGPITQAARLAEETVAIEAKKAKEDAAKSEKETTAKQTTKSSTAKKTAAKSTTPAYKDGDLSDSVILTEIMPNPDGNDTKNEWIEITNTGETDINLGNWTLDDGENGSKPYAVPDELVILAGEAMIFPITDTKISLGNTEDTVRLYDRLETIMSEVPYEGAPSGQSYGLIETTTEDGETLSEWLWTDNPTPGVPNPRYAEINAEIVSSPDFTAEYFFTVKTAEESDLKIFFSEKEIQAPLAKATLLPGTRLKLVVSEADGLTKLVRYEVLAPPAEPKSDDLMVPGIVGSLLTAGGSSIWFLRKKIPMWFLMRTKT